MSNPNPCFQGRPTRGAWTDFIGETMYYWIWCIALPSWLEVRYSLRCAHRFLLKGLNYLIALFVLYWSSLNHGGRPFTVFA